MKKINFIALLSIITVLSLTINDVNAQNGGIKKGSGRTFGQSIAAGVKKSPVGFLVPQPCGDGFQVNIFFDGTTDPVNPNWAFKYEVLGPGYNYIGFISDGETTSLNFTPCQPHTIHFYGYLGDQNTISQTITFISDGCNNNYVC